MSLSAKQAADAVGISRHGIIKAIRDGRISGKKNNKGEWSIEPAELFRVYTPVNQDNSEQVKDNSSQNTPNSSPSIQLENTRLQAELKAAEKRIADLEEDKRDLRDQRDSWQTQAQQLLLKSPQKPVGGNKRFLWWKRTADD